MRRYQVTVCVAAEVGLAELESVDVRLASAAEFAAVLAELSEETPEVLTPPAQATWVV